MEEKIFYLVIKVEQLNQIYVKNLRFMQLIKNILVLKNMKF